MAKIAYDGTHFLGSQIQSQTKETVFGYFESALRSLGIESRVVASGRTDRAVHATGQVCHFDLSDYWSDTTKLRRILNQKLPHSIHIKELKRVDESFHARYSAKCRAYRYIIKVGEASPFLANYVTFVEHFCLEDVQKKMALFVGERDFGAFRKKGSDEKSSIREIYRAFAYEHKGFFVLYFEANGFLRSQIRLMVSALLRLNTSEIEARLQNANQKALKPAPANGLYLARIRY